LELLGSQLNLLLLDTDVVQGVVASFFQLRDFPLDNEVSCALISLGQFKGGAQEIALFFE
jgi:hypothetical protein